MSFPVPPSVTPWKMLENAPTFAVSPTTTPMSIIVVNPAGRTREDGTTDCKTTGSNTVVSVCKNLP